jgi:hypothetical protein
MRVLNIRGTIIHRKGSGRRGDPLIAARDRETIPLEMQLTAASSKFAIARGALAAREARALPRMTERFTAPAPVDKAARNLSRLSVAKTGVADEL